MNTQTQTQNKLSPEVSNFLKCNLSCEAYSLVNVMGGIDYEYVDGKLKVTLNEDKIGNYIIEKANKDLEIIAQRIAARSARTEILEGDVIEYLDGHTERVTHVWEDGQIQAGGGSGSYYMGKSGYASYSGGLNSGLKLSQLELTERTKECCFWFFSGDMSGANRGVSFLCPVKVWKQIS